MSVATKERTSHGPETIMIEPGVHHPTISGSIYSSERKANTLAFNLQSEWDRAKEGGRNYLPTFIDNSHFYAIETHVKGRATLFDYKIKNGRLYYPNTEIDAISSFRKPIQDHSRPSWLRLRDERDLRAVQGISEDLTGAKIGTTWISSSPAIPDEAVPMGEKEKWGYGRHSFLFLHQLQKDPINGETKLVCRALRHYLPEKSQEELVEKLSGMPIPEDRILHGYVAKLNLEELPSDFKVQDSLHIAHIHSVGDMVAKDNGSTYWSGDDKSSGTDVDIREASTLEKMRSIDWWLEDIYKDICSLPKNPSFSELSVIEKKFRGWESAVKTISNGGDLSPELMKYIPKNPNGKLWRESIDVLDPRLIHIQLGMQMAGGLGTCGSGVGFGLGLPGSISQQEVNNYGIHGIMTSWSGMALGINGGYYKVETTTRYESYKCPNMKCQKWLSGESKVDKKSWRRSCEHCGEKLQC